MIKAVIFDFNGTLFEDTHIHVDVWIQYFKDKLNYEMSKEEFFSRIFGRDNNAIIKDMFQIDDLNEIHRISEEKEELYRDICKTMNISLVEGAEEFFDELVKRKIPFTIASGANISNMKFYFEVFGLDRWFDFSKVVCDDGYLPGKPDPTVYLLACEKLGVDPKDCLVCEDSLAGIKAAKSAGIEEIYVLTQDKKIEGVTDNFINYYELLDKLC